MKFLALLIALTQQSGQQAPDPNVLAYSNLLLGLKFSYPKTWEVTTNKKSESRILIPIENTSDRAVIEVIPVNFRGEPQIWQLSQVGINHTLKRDIERQWDEEILGVPLLLTKVSYTEQGSQKTAETGLVYTLGFNKMMYRITASPDEFDKADYAWRQVLQSLRTWDGEMPTVEDPSKKIERKEVPKGGFAKDEVAHPQIPHEINGQGAFKPVKSPIAANFEFGGHKLELRLPAGWKAEPRKDGSYVLTEAGVNGPVTLAAYPVAGADPADIALQKASANSLNDFTRVDSRDESLPTRNKAGAIVAAVWRSGKNASGALFSCEGSCQSGDYYLIASFRTTEAARWKAERAQIQALLDRMSIETTP